MRTKEREKRSRKKERERDHSPTATGRLSALKHADQVESLLLGQGINGDGTAGPSPNDSNPLDSNHGVLIYGNDGIELNSGGNRLVERGIPQKMGQLPGIIEI